MAKGKAKVNYLHRAGLVGHSDAPDWSYIYDTSLIKSDKWDIGDRVVLPDGREFRYGLSTTALITPMGCAFTSSGLIAYTSAVIAAAVDDTKVVVPDATHAAAFAIDELRGGYVTIFKAGVVQFRGIVGNSYSAIDKAVTLYLDGPLDATVTTSSAYEVFGNPYRYLGQGSDVTLGIAGPPAVAVAAAATYFWCQIKGPTFINPQSTVNNDDGAERSANWRHDGSLEGKGTSLGATVPANDSSQHAGFRIAGDAAAAGPLFMLQG